jgi:hypothetical protein
MESPPFILAHETIISFRFHQAFNPKSNLSLTPVRSMGDFAISANKFDYCGSGRHRNYFELVARFFVHQPCGSGSLHSVYLER